MPVPRILVVDDDRDCRRALLRILGTRYRVTDVTSAEAALELLLYGEPFDVILSDLAMGGWSGADLYRRIVRSGNVHASRFVLLSGEDVQSRHPALALELGMRLLQKPVDPVVLHSVLTTVRSLAAEPSHGFESSGNAVGGPTT